MEKGVLEDIVVYVDEKTCGLLRQVERHYCEELGEARGGEGVRAIIGTQQTFLGLAQNGDAEPAEISGEDRLAAAEGGRGEDRL